MVKKIVITVISLIFHLFILSLFFYYIFLPIAKWYYNHYLLGVDFFLTATFVNFLKNNFTFPFNGYLDFWWSGIPLTTVLNPVHYYLIVPLTKYLSVINSIKVYMLATVFLSGFFSYLVAFKLTKNHFVSAVLASLILYSEALYGSLTWGGSLPYFATQMFLPLIVYTILVHLERNDKKFLIISAGLLGIAFLAHVLPMLSFTVPLIVLLIVFGFRKNSFSFKKKIIEVLILGIVTFFSAYHVTMNLLSMFLNIFLSRGAALTAVVGGNTERNLPDYVRSRFPVLFERVNQLFYPLLIISLVIFLIAFISGKKRKEAFFTVFPFLLFTIYIIAQVAANTYGLPFLNQAWYRAYWPFTFALAFLIASLVGATRILLELRSKLFVVFAYLFFGTIFIAVLATAYLGKLPTKMFEEINNNYQLSSPSSAYPEAWQLVNSEREREQLEKQLLPSWIDPNERNYRLYESDAQVNIWWSYAYPQIPLVRGYIDQPLATIRLGNIFMLDQALGYDGLVKNFNYETEIAKNIALYYIDWYAIKYFEGGHLSLSPNVGPSSYLQEAIDKTEQTKTTGVIRLYETASGRPEVYKDVEQFFIFYKFRDELTSPIISSTTTPLVLVVSDDLSYEYFTKVLSYENINSRQIIPLWKSEYLDDYSSEELKQFSAIFAYNYKYKNRDRAYKNLTEYVKNGGKLFIDTGFDIPDAESSNLPELFPFSESVRETLGDSWGLEFANNKITKGLSEEDFGPPLYEKYPWKFTYPQGEIQEGAKILLKNHQKPILISYDIGNGKVIWSGMNIIYHITSSQAKKERQIVTSILKEFIPLETHQPIIGEANFISPKQITFNVSGGQGVLLKEQRYSSWEVKVNGKRTDTYVAGPDYPGFIYVPFNNQQGPYQVFFEFKGDFEYYKVWFIMSLTYIVVIDYVFLKSVLFGRIIRFVKLKLSKKISRWWEKEEE